TGYQTIQTYMERDYKIPTGFEDYGYVSQLLQAEGMKTAIEAHRRARPYCMGTLYWQLNDCWPVTSWSSVDYFGNWKAFHYQAKRSFEKVLVTVAEADNQVKVYVVNDELATKEGQLVLQLLDFNGKVLWEQMTGVQSAANSSAVFYSIAKKEFEAFDAKQMVLAVTLLSDDAEVKRALHYFVKPKDMALTVPRIIVSQIDENTIEVTTDVLAKNVFLQAGKVKFSDNYFDLLPGEKKEIRFEGAIKGVQVKSLNGY
ncbi:MAG: glycoside hydrolase family 2 protein, partial [Flavobacterium sp.]|nr:glycoside hydrolase family 2 protein [Flavobacterium sp.]